MSIFTNHEILILSVLSTPLYGKDIIEAVKKEHDIDITLGGLYATLGRLIEHKLVERIEGEQVQGTSLQRVCYLRTRAGHDMIIERDLEIIQNMDTTIGKYGV